MTIANVMTAADTISFDLGAGNDTFTSSVSFVSVDGGSGDDTITTGAIGGNTFDGGAGSTSSSPAPPATR